MLGSHPRHDAIVVTHDYLNATRGARSHLDGASQADGSNAVGGSDGERLFQMVRRHPNVFLVLCGNDDGEGYLLSRGDHGQAIHQLMSNYQQWPNGGDLTLTLTRTRTRTLTLTPTPTPTLTR